MRALRPLRNFAVLFAALTASACAGGATASAPAPQPAPAPAKPDLGELEEIYRARLESERTRFTEADVAFMNGMIGHHAQALLMSRLALSHGASPQVQTLAARIINAQEDEIATMQRWLRDRGQEVPEVHIMDDELMVHGPEHTMHMPGMLTQEQLRELDRARGPEFDRLFLTYMIEHHRGAVSMVRDLFATDGAGQDEAVFKFASDVQVDQSTEIARMELMLSAFEAEGPRR